jgi:hypothetical protein
MAKQIHYEVFVMNGGSKTWTLHEAFDDRGPAMNSAKYALLQKAFSGAKVVKEIQDLDTGEYTPITIFEEGGYEIVKKGKEEVSLPCVTPQDLYSPHARIMISRVLEDALDRWGVTAMELLHRADLLEELQAAGTVLQHAMQKWAITQSTSQHVPVAEVMKQLNELVSRGMEKSFQDDRAKLFPKIKNHDLAKAWEVAGRTAEAGYVLRGSIAASMKKLDRPSEKLSFLLEYMDHLPKTDMGKKTALDAIDDFVSEIVSGKASLADLIGNQTDLGASLILLIDLFMGKVANTDIAGHKGLKVLASCFGKDQLPHSRSSVIKRVLAELNGIKRLAPDDIQREVDLTRLLAKRMVLCQGPMASIDDIIAAFEKRSTRLTMPELAEEYMEPGSTPDQRIDLLLDLEDNIIGDNNKARLVDYIAPILTGPKMEPYFLNTEEPLLRRLSRLASLQVRVLESGFPDPEKERLMDDFDKLCTRVEEAGKLFGSIAARSVSSAEKAVTVLRLLDAKVFTTGECSVNAARHIAKFMRADDFSDALGDVKFPVKPEAPDEPVNPAARFSELVKSTGVHQLLKRREDDEAKAS